MVAVWPVLKVMVTPARLLRPEVTLPETVITGVALKFWAVRSVVRLV